MRRRSDREQSRTIRLLLAMSIALGLLSAYLAQRAIRAMDASLEAYESAFQLGLNIGRSKHMDLPGMGEAK